MSDPAIGLLILAIGLPAAIAAWRKWRQAPAHQDDDWHEPPP